MSGKRIAEMLEENPAAAEQFCEDLRSLMRERWGRRLAYALTYGFGKVLARSAALGIKSDPHPHTYFAEGWQDNAGQLLELLGDLEPDRVLDMFEEFTAARRAELALARKHEKRSAGEST